MMSVSFFDNGEKVVCMIVQVSDSTGQAGYAPAPLEPQPLGSTRKWSAHRIFQELPEEFPVFRSEEWALLYANAMYEMIVKQYPLDAMALVSSIMIDSFRASWCTKSELHLETLHGLN